MTRKRRLLLFIILLILFLLVAPSTVLYSFGYRFDFDTKKITQTGGFYFKVLPKSAQVYIDKKLSKRTDFFFGAVFINNLLPQKYEVEIKKDGYHSWKKTLEIKEKQVTDAKNVVLFSQNPELKALSQNVEEFFVSPDQKKMILKEAGEFAEGKPSSAQAERRARDERSSASHPFASAREKEWSLKLLELDKNIKSHLASQKDLATSSLTQFVDTFFGAEQKIGRGRASQDLGKIAYSANAEVWVMFLKEEFGQPQKKAGERLLVARFSEKIGDIFWLTNHYLIFNTGNKIKIAEVDDRNGINIIDLADFEKPKIFFNQANKKLYILSERKLYASQRLLP